jgi:hypothetical protein
MNLYEVVSPVGQSSATRVAVATRLETLNGKTICEVANGDAFRCSWSFPIIRDVLQKHYPGVRIVPFTELPGVNVEVLTPETKDKTWQDLRAAYQKHKCDAIISQMGA